MHYQTSIIPRPDDAPPQKGGQGDWFPSAINEASDRALRSAKARIAYKAHRTNRVLLLSVKGRNYRVKNNGCTYIIAVPTNRGNLEIEVFLSALAKAYQHGAIPDSGIYAIALNGAPVPREMHQPIIEAINCGLDPEMAALLA